MPKKKDDQEITVEAEVSVTDAAGARKVVRRFDVAWAMAMDWASSGTEKPIYIKFERFVRKED